MSKDKRNYVLYTLTKDYKTNKYEFRPYYYTRNSLVHKIAFNEVYCKNGFVSKSILSNLDKNAPKEVPLLNTAESYKRFVDREIIFYKDGEIIFRADIDKCYLYKIDKNGITPFDIENFKDNIINKIEKINKKREKWELSNRARKRSEVYTFRKGPVPNIHNYNNLHYGCCYRTPRVLRVIRYCDNEENMELLKPKDRRKNSPMYLEKARYNDRSWKSSCKIEKQWQKHIRRHVDTVVYNKNTYLIDDIEEDVA